MRGPDGTLDTHFNASIPPREGFERVFACVIEMDHLITSEVPDEEYVAELLMTAFRDGALWARQNPGKEIR